jgi:hypothetical protein
MGIKEKENIIRALCENQEEAENIIKDIDEKTKICMHEELIDAVILCKKFGVF